MKLDFFCGSWRSFGCVMLILSLPSDYERVTGPTERLNIIWEHNILVLTPQRLLRKMVEKGLNHARSSRRIAAAFGQ